MEGGDMDLYPSSMMFDDLWMAEMWGPWLHSCIHHSHYPLLIDWVILGAFSLSAKLWKVKYCLCAGHQWGFRCEAGGSGMFHLRVDPRDVNLRVLDSTRGIAAIHEKLEQNFPIEIQMGKQWLQLCQYDVWRWGIDIPNLLFWGLFIGQLTNDDEWWWAKPCFSKPCLQLVTLPAYPSGS